MMKLPKVIHAFWIMLFLLMSHVSTPHDETTAVRVPLQAESVRPVLVEHMERPVSCLVSRYRLQGRTESGCPLSRVTISR